MTGDTSCETRSFLSSYGLLDSVLLAAGSPWVAFGSNKCKIVFDNSALGVRIRLRRLTDTLNRFCNMIEIKLYN